MNRARLLVSFLLAAGMAFAQREMTVAQLVTFIKSSVQQHNPDKDVAAFVARIKVTNKLDDQTVEDLQGAGAGRLTVAALRKLSATSATLQEAPPPPLPTKPVVVVIPPPSSIEQKAILDQIKEQALNYTDNLPNYICTQVTRRHVDPSGTENYSLADTVQEQLTFFDRKESYKVTMVNNRSVTNTDHTQLGGATSSGEFGTMLREIFLSPPPRLNSIGSDGPLCVGGECMFSTFGWSRSIPSIPSITWSRAGRSLPVTTD